MATGGNLCDCGVVLTLHKSRKESQNSCVQAPTGALSLQRACLYNIDRGGFTTILRIASHSRTGSGRDREGRNQIRHYNFTTYAECDLALMPIACTYCCFRARMRSTSMKKSGTNQHTALLTVTQSKSWY